MSPGDLVVAVEGLIGEQAIVTGTEKERKIYKGEFVYFNWVTVSWTANNAVTTMPRNHFKLIRKALDA